MIALLLQFLPQLLGLSAIVGGITFIFLKGRSSGKASEVRKQEKANVDFQEQVKESDDSISHAGDDDLDRRLRDNSVNLRR